MELGNRVKLYSGILFGKIGNSVGTRFKLVRSIAKHGPENFYIGMRADNVCGMDFILETIFSDYCNPDKIIFCLDNPRFHLRPSVFRHKVGSNVYYDVMDGTECKLIDRFNHEAEYGCCNLQKVKNYNELANIKFRKDI